MLKPWKVVGSKITYEDQWLKVRSDDCLTDNDHLVSPYHVLDYPNWVHIIAITPAFELVLVRQYRHGVGQILLELPCGAIEATDSSPLDAAIRELQEETGYLTDSMVQLGPLHVNPATHTNSIWPVLGLGARHVQSPALNATENVEVVPADIGAFVASVRDGTVRLQALHTASLWLGLNWIEASTRPELVTLHGKIAGSRKASR